MWEEDWIIGGSKHARKGNLLFPRYSFSSKTKPHITKVIFVDKDKVLLQRPVAEVMKAAPCFETLLVICKRDQMDTLAIEEAKDIFKEWSEKYNAELAKKATKET